MIGRYNIPANMTPEQLDRRRAIVRQMMPSGSARYVGEGLTDLASGIVGGLANRRLDQIEPKVDAIAEAPDLTDMQSPKPEDEIIAQIVARANQRSAAPDPMALSGGGGQDAMAGGGGADMLGVPQRPIPAEMTSPGMLPPDTTGGVVTGRPSRLPGITTQTDLRAASGITGTPFPQGPNSGAPAAMPAQPQGGYRLPQGRPMPEDEFDPNLIMEASAPEGMGMGMSFERQPRMRPEARGGDGPKTEAPTREFRQDLRTGQGVADLGMNTTEGQVTGYALRAQEAAGILDQFEQEGTNFWARAASVMPGNTENMLLSSDYQQYLNAEQNFLAAVLRRDTGAAITNEEFRLYRPMFFPQPGDSPETLAQKRRMREQALLGLRAGAGEGIAVLPPMGGQPPQPTAAPTPAQGGQPQPTHRFNPATGQIEAIQ